MSSAVVAHRGLARLYPENTRLSVLAALAAGLDKVEIDVQLSADGVPVVQHDTDLKRMSGKAGDLRRLPWAKLRQVRTPEPGRFGRRYADVKLSGLADLAEELVGWPKFTLFVELKEESLKHFGREAMLAAVAEALRPVQKRCVLISFDLAVLQLARRDTRYPVGPVLRTLRQLQAPAFKALRPEWAFCDAKLLPAQGALRPLFGRAKSCVYEVPQVERARALLQRGIHAIETFHADCLAQELSLYH